MDLLKIYDYGVKFLEENPSLKRLNERLSNFVIGKCQKKKLFHMKGAETPPLTENDLKRMAVLMFCVAGVFFVFAIIKLLQCYLLEFIILLVPVFILYTIGVNNIAETKLSKETKVSKDKPLSVSATQSVTTFQIPMPEEKKVEQKPQKTPFWRIFDWVERIVVWGWIYISFAYPESIQEYVKQYHIWDYLPHEQMKDKQFDKISYLFLGLIILALTFALLRGVLKILFFIFKKLFSKRDVREL